MGRSDNHMSEHDPDYIDADDTCQRCDGDGGYHDCGEDTCCCALGDDPDPDWVTCEDCGGTGCG
jgi:hypothetical protein